MICFYEVNYSAFHFLCENCFDNGSTKQFGPALKFILSLCVPVLLLSWPPIGIISSILCGAAYGFFAPILATFKAVGEGKTDKFFHCIQVWHKRFWMFIIGLK